MNEDRLERARRIGHAGGVLIGVGIIAGVLGLIGLVLLTVGKMFLWMIGN